MDQKTVFISYRRSTSKHLARSIYQDLKMNGWDVFLDVNTIDSGDFDRIILNQIGARAHFILLISADSLKRCANPGDWVLREIEEAVRLERNIIPIIEEGADFSTEMSYLPEVLRGAVSKKSGLPLPHYFFDAAMDILRTRFLKTPKYVPIQAAPAADQDEVQKRIAAAEAEPLDERASKLASQTSPSNQHNTRQAFELINAGRRDEAIRILLPLLQADENNANAWWLLANCLSDPDDAREALENLLRLQPAHAKGLAMLDDINARHP